MTKAKNLLRRFLNLLGFAIAVSVAMILVIAIWLLATQSSSPNTAIGIAAIAAFSAFLSSMANWKLVSDAEKERSKSERPYVRAYFDVKSSGMVEFVVENVGNSPAINVSVEFDQAPIDHTGKLLSEVSLFEEAISFLLPDKPLHQLVDTGWNLLKGDKPKRFRYKVVYYATSGRRYVDPWEMNFEMLRDTPLPEGTVEEQLKSLTKSIDDLVKLFRSIIGSGSLIVENPEQRKDRLTQQIKRAKTALNKPAEESKWKRPIVAGLYWILSKLE